MNLLHSMLESPIVHRLGWVLLHSLWEGTGVAAVLAVVLACLRRGSPQARYVAACGAMGLIAALPVITFELTMPALPVSSPRVAVDGGPARERLAGAATDTARSLIWEPSDPAVAPTAGLATAERLSGERQMRAPVAIPLWERTIQAISVSAPLFVLAWAAGVLVLSLWNLGGWVALHRLKARTARPAGDALHQTAQKLCRRLGLAAGVGLAESAAVFSPLVIGAFKPLILLPASVLSELPPAQIESVLAHELAHVRRHDYLVNLLQTAIETLLFYHPAVWWISRRIRAERENCCDDIALSLTHDRVTYVRALAAVAGARPPALAAAAGGRVLFRVRRILGLPEQSAARAPRWLSGAVALALLLALVVSASLRVPAAGAKAAALPTTQPSGMEVTVTDQATGLPLADVELHTVMHVRQPPVTTDANGRARIALPPDTVALNLWAKKSGYVPTVAHWDTTRGHDLIPARFSIRLERGTSIGGTVVDEHGAPIRGVTVCVAARSPERKAAAPVSTQVYDDAFVTDERGKWRCDIIPKDAEEVSLRLSHPDFASDQIYGQSGRPTLDQLRAMSDTLVLKEGVTVAGRVLETSGTPIMRARVVLGQNSLGLHAPETRSDAGGRFVLRHCRTDERAVLVATADGHAPEVRQFRLNQDVKNLEVRLSAAKPLVVRVVDPQGRPLPGTRLFIQRWRDSNLVQWDAHTDADGRAVWKEAPADTVLYDISHEGYVQVPDQPLTATGQQQTVTLLPELKVSGTVVDDQSGKPVEHFRVLNGWTSSGRSPFWERDGNDGPILGREGQFQFTEDLARDGYAVRIEADGYLPTESRVFHKEEGSVMFQFRLKKAADIRQTLVTPDGRPLAGADVLVVTPSSQIIVKGSSVSKQQTFALRTKTDAEGRFRLPPQLENYWLMVVHDQGFAQLKPAQLGGSSPMRVPPWGRVEGMARVGAKAAAGQTISALPRDNPDLSGHVTVEDEAVADGNGHFVLEHVPPGKTDIAIQVKSYEGLTWSSYTWTQRTRVDVEAGKTSQVTIGGKGRPVVGRFVGTPSLAGRINSFDASCWISTKLRLPDHALPPDWQKLDANARRRWNEQWQKSPEVQAYEKAREAAIYVFVRIADDGAFRAEDVPAGSYELRVQVMTPPNSASHRVLASAAQDIVVPEMPGGRSDEPLDAGNIELKEHL